MIRSQKSEVRSQKSEIRSQKLRTTDHGQLTKVEFSTRRKGRRNMPEIMALFSFVKAMPIENLESA